MLTEYHTEKYRIVMYEDATFTENSTDIVHPYDVTYIRASDYRIPSIFGISIYHDGVLLKSVCIGSDGGATSIHQTSTIIDNDRLVVCCSDSVFCLSIPELSLEWRTQADDITCFQIFSYQDSYIIHGECCISRLSKDGEILWQQGGADIFVNIDGADGCVLTDNSIVATDFTNRKYTFDFSGKIIA